MNTRDFIIARQQQWALNRGIDLVGSAGTRGVRAYTKTLEENLFEPLSPAAEREIGGGDGGELKRSGRKPAKMQALHSSSALGVNIFHYWNRPDRVNEIAAACGFCGRGGKSSERIAFEAKFEIAEGQKPWPNIDVVIENKKAARTAVFAAECKFTEAYGGRHHGGLKRAYMDLDHQWKGLGHLKKFASTISPDDKIYHHLHPAQLIKHILGLRNTHGDRFRLLYLWYDALGEDGARHRAEADEFAAIAKKDGVLFHHLTYQELIAKIARAHREDHPEYVEYVTERYL